MMKLIYAARFAFASFLLAASFTFWQLAQGLAVKVVQFRRLGWIVENPLYWSIGWWLWMIAIFAWMWLLVSLAWAYLPTHRMQSMLQSGLMVIAALLAMVGAIVWWSTLPVIAAQQSATSQIDLVDALALGLLGAALGMGGLVTAWVGYDVMQQRQFPRIWTLFLIGAGLFAAFSPFVFPIYWHLVGALLCWLVWCGYLATRLQLPHAFAEWK